MEIIGFIDNPLFEHITFYQIEPDGLICLILLPWSTKFLQRFVWNNYIIVVKVPQCEILILFTKILPINKLLTKFLWKIERCQNSWETPIKGNPEWSTTLPTELPQMIPKILLTQSNFINTGDLTNPAMATPANCPENWPTNQFSLCQPNFQPVFDLQVDP